MKRFIKLGYFMLDRSFGECYNTQGIFQYGQWLLKTLPDLPPDTQTFNFTGLVWEGCTFCFFFFFLFLRQNGFCVTLWSRSLTWKDSSSKLDIRLYDVYSLCCRPTSSVQQFNIGSYYIFVYNTTFYTNLLLINLHYYFVYYLYICVLLN